MKRYKIWRRPHGYFGGGILDPLIFPTITTRTGDADIDLIVEIYEQQATCEDDKGGKNPQKGGGIHRCLQPIYQRGYCYDNNDKS